MTELLAKDSMESIRRDMTAIREAHGADSEIGHRCSNIVELIQMEKPPARLIARQMADLQQLLDGLQ